MKYKVKLFIFGVETFMIFCIVSTMIFTRIYNGSYFLIFHQFDKQEHLILKKKISKSQIERIIYNKSWYDENYKPPKSRQRNIITYKIDENK